MIDARGDGDVRVVRLDRPARRNALTPEGLEQLRVAVADATEPVVYLTGAGSAFCAGADLDVVESLDADGAADLARKGQRVARTVAETDAVVVAGVDGAARGGGVELALACDLRVATDRATFAQPGVQRGLFGAWGGTVRLPEVVGPSDAMDLSLTGRVVDATDAREMGLVSRIVADPRAVADEVAATDRDALATLKARLRDDAHRTTREHREVAAFAALAPWTGLREQ